MVVLPSVTDRKFPKNRVTFFGVFFGKKFQKFPSEITRPVTNSRNITSEFNIYNINPKYTFMFTTEIGLGL